MPNVLIIEDEPAFARIIGDYLEESEIDFDIALNREEAAKKLKATKYDVIVLDIILPTLDSKDDPKEEGFKIAETIRSNPRTENIPIIFCTILRDLINDKRVEKYGSAFIPKPFNPEELIDKIKSFCLSGKK